MTWLLAAIPVALALQAAQASALVTFLVACLAIIPLARFMGRSTECLATTLGANIGGLLNATFGNAPELIIGLSLIARGPSTYPLVKASLVGSVIGNVLFVLGTAFVAGGLRFPKQTFDRTAASLGSTLLLLAAVGLVVPTFFGFLHPPALAALPRPATYLSIEVAGVLIGVYALSLVFSLKTHGHLYTGRPEEGAARPVWGKAPAIAVLAAATLGVQLMSRIIVGTVEAAAADANVSQVFVGVIVIAMIGNAAEHATAVQMALKDRMDTVLSIAVGSSLQIALFVAPVLVFASLAFGRMFGFAPGLDLQFPPLLAAAVLVSAAALALVSHDGESNWMEGVLMLAIYLILGIAFFNEP